MIHTGEISMDGNVRRLYMTLSNETGQVMNPAPYDLLGDMGAFDGIRSIRIRVEVDVEEERPHHLLNSPNY